MRRILAMDEKLHELRRRLDQKTTEIETVVAAERGIGSIHEMDPSDYERCNRMWRNCWAVGKKPPKSKDRGAWTTPH
jgi:hypothetical protein